MTKNSWIAALLVLGVTYSPLMSKEVKENTSVGINGNDKNEKKSNSFGPIWRPFLVVDLERVSEDLKELNETYEIDGNFIDGDTILNVGRAVSVFDAVGRIRKVITLKKGVAIPSFPSNVIYSSIKYRNGHFFARDNGSIMRYDEKSNSWIKIFKTMRTFSQFDISPQNKIILVCPGLKDSNVVCLEGDPGPDVYLTTEYFSEGKLNLIEIFSAKNGERPESTIPLPANLKETYRLTNRVPLLDKVFRVDRYLFLSGSQMAQLYRFDLVDQRLVEVPVPWPRLDWEFLTERQLLCSSVKEGKGVVKISRFSFPDRILFYPQDSKNVLIQVRMPSAFDPGFSLERDRLERKGGNRFAPLTREFSEAEKTSRQWLKYYNYNITKNEFTALDLPKLGGSRVDCSRHYLFSTDEAVPFATLNQGRAL